MLADLFDDAGLTAHGFCLSWDSRLIALHLVSDALIGIAYFSIPLALVVFVMRRRDLVFRRVFWLFVVFILACGSTHFMGIWTLWRPDYAAEGALKAVTAAVSVLTAVQLWPLLPRALALPSPAMLHAANEALRQQVRERDAAVEALRRETLERERAEDMLRHSQKLEAIGHLTGGIAHDFNNLLTVVMANLEMLDGRLAADAGLRKYVDRAMQGATRGAALTRQLLAFARRQPLRPAALHVGERMAPLAELLGATLGPNIEVETGAAADLWLAKADPNQLESALLNLAINARDAMPRGGTLTVRAANVTLDAAALGAERDVEPGAFVAVAVSDTGAGMTAEVRQAAFDPFFTTKPVGGGTGLGLSQVYGFIKQSKGHVTLDSTAGHGTTVTLYLPRAAVSAEAPLTVS